MDKVKLPEFITFNNCNNESLDLVAKKELELNDLSSVMHFKKFLKIFDDYPNLKLLNLKVDRILAGADSMVLFLSRNLSTFFKKDVLNDGPAVFDMASDILRDNHYVNIDNAGGIIVDRNEDYFNKLKVVFGIEHLKDDFIKKTIKINDVVLKDEISSGFDAIFHLKNQYMILSVLNLFKKNNNLEKINLSIDRSSGRANIGMSEVSFFDGYSDDDGTIIVEEIKNIIEDKRLYTPVVIDKPEVVEIRRGNLSDIKKFIKNVFHFEGLFEDFSIVIENEILEESITKSAKDSRQKIKI